MLSVIIGGIAQSLTNLRREKLIDMNDIENLVNDGEEKVEVKVK